MKKMATIAGICFLVFAFQFCSKKDSSVTVSVSKELQPALPATAFNYIINFPACIQTSLVANDNTPADNPITNDGATLGRVLFYDKQLSENNTISCGSCHQQQFSFDDTATLSKGFERALTARNTLAVLNVRFYKNGKMFWDERAPTLEKQALVPIQNHAEMGLTLAELESKVQALSYYPPLFLKAFGSTRIDSVLIAKALAQFERSIVTYQSKYDSVKQGFKSFTTAEAQGKQLFLHAGAPGTCASCHTPPMFITSSPDAPFALADSTDLGIDNKNNFKSGTLRNISNREKLFHNGSIADATAMLTAGDAGSKIKHIPLHSVPLNEVQNLLAFCNTLTDNSIATEIKYSDPFK